MLIIAQVLKEKWLKITGFSHSQTTNKLVNKAANDSARVSGQDHKNPPALGTNQITEFGGFRPLASLEKNKMAYYICGQYFGFNISLTHSQSYMEVHIAPYQTCSLNPPRALTRVAGGIFAHSSRKEWRKAANDLPSCVSLRVRSAAPSAKKNSTSAKVLILL